MIKDQRMTMPFQGFAGLTKMCHPPVFKSNPTEMPSNSNALFNMQVLNNRLLPCQPCKSTTSCDEMFSNFEVDPSSSKVKLPPLMRPDAAKIAYVHVDDKSTPSFQFSRHSQSDMR